MPTTLARAMSLAVLLAVAASPARLAGEPQEPAWRHSSHLPVSDGEQRLRGLLGRYASGAHEAAAREALSAPPGWIAAATSAALRRADEELEYHRRPEQRLGPLRDARIARYIRGDRLQLLLLAAALQVDASTMSADVNVVGGHITNAERAVDALFDLRDDFRENGPLPYPIAVDVPWDPAVLEGPEAPRTADWAGVRAFVGRWYRAAIASLQGIVELDLVSVLISRGLSRAPDDHALLLARGTLAETIVRLREVDSSVLSRLHDAWQVEKWRLQLGDAARDYERAARAGAPAMEAMVRLGRVRFLLGQSERAREALTKALAVDGPARMRYLALLFRGAVAERADDPSSATTDYEAAASLMPDAQTPRLALSRVADEHGSAADARRWIDLALAARSGSEDPWRHYNFGQVWQLRERVASLRALDTP